MLSLIVNQENYMEPDYMKLHRDMIGINEFFSTLVKVRASILKQTFCNVNVITFALHLHCFGIKLTKGKRIS